MAVFGFDSSFPIGYSAGWHRPHLVVLSGAGISVESGLSTFRGPGGLWRSYSFERISSCEAWRRDPEVVLEFFNERRAQLQHASPNAAHMALAELESDYDVSIVTQNIDDLHERAGSGRVLHLHGELTQAKSEVDEGYVFDIGYNPIHMGDRCPRGGQLRPNVVWFGEPVPMIPHAAQIVAHAEIFVIVGTSLNVYPAAGLLECVREDVPIFLIDPNPPKVQLPENAEVIQATASEGIQILAERIKQLS